MTQSASRSRAVAWRRPPAKMHISGERADILANRGYAVLSVNFRGSTGFGKTFTNAGDKQWGKAMHADLLDAVAWAVSSGVTSKDKVCIMGGSYGGYATLAGLTLTADMFACGVDIVGPPSVVTLLETIPPYWAPMIKLCHGRVGDPTTPEGRQALLEISPLTHAAKITKPLLIGQGQNDPRVKKTESDQIVAAMNAKKIPVTATWYSPTRATALPGPKTTSPSTRRLKHFCPCTSVATTSRSPKPSSRRRRCSWSPAGSGCPACLERWFRSAHRPIAERYPFDRL